VGSDGEDLEHVTKEFNSIVDMMEQLKAIPLSEASQLLRETILRQNKAPSETDQMQRPRLTAQINITNAI
jgi:Asp-tRNA(Asn)/Glu-tRNA(Gln) amidotransferase C subunit